jgi:crotonobetainyl-CoA:carnitine CoA-transferase CaiB-like acyl-CoA transferase
MTGMYATIAVCAALAQRAHGGGGQHLDLALFDVQTAVLANQAANYLATGQSPGRLGNAHPNIVPYQTFKTADGDMILACGNDNLFRKFCAVAGCPELAADARFTSNGKRVENRAELTRLLDDIVRRRTTRDWVEALEAAGVPNGPINSIAQVFAEPQAIARGLKMEMPHPSAGKVALVRSPMRFSETPLEHRLPPPLLGEHTDEVLRGWLGRSDAQIAQLRADGAI